MNESSGWKVIAKTNNSRLDKYDSQFVVIISKGERNRYLYLMPKIMTALKNPPRIMFMSRGSNIALVGVAEDNDGYKVQTTKGGHYPYVQIMKIIDKYGLVPGVYSAHVENELVVFDSSDTPSRI